MVVEAVKVELLEEAGELAAARHGLEHAIQELGALLEGEVRVLEAAVHIIVLHIERHREQPHLRAQVQNCLRRSARD